MIFYVYADETSMSNSFYYQLGREMRAALISLYVEKYGLFVDDITDNFKDSMARLKRYFESSDYSIVLGTTEWLVRRLQGTWVPQHVEEALASERAAYRLIDGHDIVPLASDAEGEALLGALSALKTANMPGARTHLRAAASAAALGSYADSVRESMQAIESAARTLSGSSKFSDALTHVEEKHRLHPAFKRGLTALYGYSSDEEGIRHPLLENGDAAVSEADALLMLGICASTVTYLLSQK